MKAAFGIACLLSFSREGGGAESVVSGFVRLTEPYTGAPTQGMRNLEKLWAS